MKSIIALSILLLTRFFCHAQTVDLNNSITSKSDTAAYVQKNIITKKEKYINQPISTLINSLSIPVKSFIPGVSFSHPDEIPNILISFDSYNVTDSKIINRHYPVLIVVSFLIPIKRSALNPILLQSNGEWTPEVQQYFSKVLIKDLK